MPDTSKAPSTAVLAFLPQVARAYPKVPLHVVCDNYTTHKHPAVRDWLAEHPRIQLHFTPTSGSWLNMAEIFFGVITRQAIRRGTFTSVKDLVAAIGNFIDGWNEHCQPFVWTKTADEILAHSPPRKKASLTRYTRLQRRRHCTACSADVRDPTPYWLARLDEKCDTDIAGIRCRRPAG